MAKFKAPKSRTSIKADRSVATLISCSVLILIGIGLIMWLFYGLLISSPSK